MEEQAQTNEAEYRPAEVRLSQERLARLGRLYSRDALVVVGAAIKTLVDPFSWGWMMHAEQLGVQRWGKEYDRILSRLGEVPVAEINPDKRGVGNTGLLNGEKYLSEH